MVKPADDLFEVSAAAEALAENTGRLEESMTRLSESKGWTIISRMSSGIFPGFWSLQNKFRGVTDMFNVYYKGQRKATEEAIKNVNAVIKLDKLRKKLPDIYGKDFTKMKRSELQTQVKMAKQLDVFDAVVTRIGIAKGLEGSGLAKFQKNISRGKSADMREVLDELVWMTGDIKGDLDDAIDREQKAYNKRRRPFVRKKGKLEFKHIMNEVRTMTLKNRLTKRLANIDWKKFKDNIKASLMFYAKAALVISLFITFVFFMYRTIKQNTVFFGGLKKIIKSGLDLFVMSIGQVFEGIGLIAEAFSEGNILMLFEGLGRIFIGVLGAVLVPLFTLAITVIGGILGLLLGGFVELANSEKRNAKQVGSAILQFLGWAAAISALLLYFFSPAGWFTIAAVLAGAIVSLMGSVILGRSTGGVVNEGMTLVGERGPELVSLPAGSRVYTNNQSRRMSGSTVINVNVSGRVGASDAEIKDIANKVAREINLRMNRTATTGARF